jgi:hypothetical protein
MLHNSFERINDRKDHCLPIRGVSPAFAGRLRAMFACRETGDGIPASAPHSVGLENSINLPRRLRESRGDSSRISESKNRVHEKEREAEKSREISFPKRDALPPKKRCSKCRT